MISSYLLRLVCLSLASFFVVNAIGSVLITFASRALVRFAEKLRARSAAQFLFAAQLFPAALSLLLVFGLCIPSYLRLEPHSSLERIGGLCLIFAALGCVGWLASWVRVSKALASNLQFARVRRKAGSETAISAESISATIVESSQPILSIVGVFPPRLVLSRAVLTVLSPEELRLAIRHEMAHLASRDNFKRLLLLFVPAPLFGCGFPTVKSFWSRFSEWAADDEAVQSDPALAIALAGTLLRVARMGSAQPISVLQTSLCSDNHELPARVDRLLNFSLLPKRANTWSSSMTMAGGALTALLAAALLAWPMTLSSVHRLLELFLQ